MPGVEKEEIALLLSLHRWLWAHQECRIKMVIEVAERGVMG